MEGGWRSMPRAAPVARCCRRCTRPVRRRSHGWGSRRWAGGVVKRAHGCSCKSGHIRCQLCNLAAAVVAAPCGCGWPPRLPREWPLPLPTALPPRHTPQAHATPGVASAIVTELGSAGCLPMEEHFKHKARPGVCVFFGRGHRTRLAVAAACHGEPAAPNPIPRSPPFSLHGMSL